MEIFPSEFNKIGLSRYEKVFTKYAQRVDNDFGYVILHINPAMVNEKKITVVILEEGLLFCEFLDIDKPNLVSTFLTAYSKGVFSESVNIIRRKLISNKALIGEDGKLKFPINYLLMMPRCEMQNVNGLEPIKEFVNKHCLFAEDYNRLSREFENVMIERLYIDRKVSVDRMKISDNNLSSILQRIAPEYTTIRPVSKPNEDELYVPGVDDELLVMTEDDIAVRAYRLDEEQINIVNRISKGDQLILACAGSGKSVLLIAKCFKAARMNPEKKFLITCFNANLRNLYVWFIERAGMQERNVDCYTFDALCKHMLSNNDLIVPNGEGCIQERRASMRAAIEQGKIKDRYYGIFIDEVQVFEQSWYKTCYNILENKKSDEHIFVICGDKTQNITNLQKHGKAPWNAGPDYPNFRGGNKSIRIIKNYRNCIEINNYINAFSIRAKQILDQHIENEKYDPDLFLRGQAFREGIGVEVTISDNYAKNESLEVIKSIKTIHDEYKIPYDEIAVIFGYKQYKPKYYYIEGKVREDLEAVGIPYNTLYASGDSWGGHYGDGGVSLLTIKTVLGLDYRAVVLCGIFPLGMYDKTKNFGQKKSALSDKEQIALTANIRLLYVACSRAKDVLHIILPDTGEYSAYSRLLLDAYNDLEAIDDE